MLLLALSLFACAGCSTALTRSPPEDGISEELALLPPADEITTPEYSIRAGTTQFADASSLEVAPVAFWEPDEALGEPTFSLPRLAESTERKRQSSSLGSSIAADHLNYYSLDSLVKFGIGLGIGAGLANSGADEKLNVSFQKNFRYAESDEPFHMLRANKELGNGIYTLPIFATAWLGGNLFEDSKLAQLGGEWGERSLRSFLVGAPPVMVMQQVTGGSRPGETSHDSQWRPFQDNNGVSGHSFMGSLPFLNAAKMTADPWLKGVCYAGSTLAPLSRVNDAAHYPSQAFLGWWMAYLAATAIDRTETADSRWKLYPGLSSGDSGVTAELDY